MTNPEPPKPKRGPVPGSKRTERTEVWRFRCTPAELAKLTRLGPDGVRAMLAKVK